MELDTKNRRERANVKARRTYCNLVLSKRQQERWRREIENEKKGSGNDSVERDVLLVFMDLGAIVRMPERSYASMPISVLGILEVSL